MSFTEDEEELPEISFGPVTSATKRTTQQTPSKSRWVLEMILEKGRRDKVKNAHMQEARRQLAELPTQDRNDDDDKASVLTNNHLSLESLTVKESTILAKHRGEPVINVRHRFCQFSAQTHDLRDYARQDTGIDKLLQGCSPEEMVEMVTTNAICYHFSKVSDRDAVIRYLIRLLSVHQNRLVVDSCRCMLRTLLSKHPSLANSISLLEVVKILVNYGADVKRLCPSESLRQAVHCDVPLCDCDSTDVNAQTVSKSTLADNSADLLDAFLEIMAEVLRLSGSWDEDQLMVFIVMACSMIVDVNFATSTSVVILGDCIESAVSKFSDAWWESRVSILSDNICSVSEDHHTLMFLVQLFYGSPRMDQLKRVTAFHAIHKVLGIALPSTVSADILPTDVVSFLRGFTLKGSINFYLWYSILNLVNFSVSNEACSVSSQVLDELCFETKRLAGAIKEDLSCIDGTKVKDVAARICSKWSLMKSVAPISQRTLFRYMVSDSQSSNGTPNDNSQSANDKSDNADNCMDEDVGDDDRCDDLPESFTFECD